MVAALSHAAALLLGSGARADAELRAAPPSEPPVGEHARLRVGFNFNAGALVAPDTWGGGGFALRGGVQTSRLYGVYLQVMPLVFAKIAADEREARRGLLGLVSTSLLSSFTPLDWLELAIGPSFDHGGATVVFVSADGSSSTSVDQLLFGVAGRVAWHAFDRDPRTGERGGLTLGVDPHLTLVAGEPLVFFTAGFGADWY